MSRAAKNLSHRSIHRRHTGALWLILFIGVWVSLWMAASYHLNERMDSWGAKAKKDGSTLTYSDRYTDGSPWMLHVHLKDFIYKHPKGHRLEADEAVLYLPLWNWNSLSAKFKGLIRGQVDQLSFHTQGLKLGLAQYDVTSFDEVSTAFHVDALGFTPQIKHDLVLGRTIAKLSFDLKLMGISPSFDNTNSLQTWSAKGGVFELEDIALSWGPLALLARGTLTLDNELQPSGVFSARLRGLSKTLALCREKACLSPMEEKMLNVSLNVLSRPSGLTGNSSPVVPFSIQHGGLYIGPVKLADVPKIGAREE